MTHEFDAQRTETFETFVELRKQDGVPKRAVVHFLFYAEDMEPDWTAVEKALTNSGFRVERDEEEGMIDAAVGPIDITPESIWDHEKAATEIALKWDFHPDGWDMLEDGA